jgi:predicted RNase H-like HicB family nuclease
MNKSFLILFCGFLMYTATMTVRAQSEDNTRYYREFQVVSSDGKYGLLFRDEVVVPYEYDEIVAQRDNRGFISKQGDKYGIIGIGVTNHIPTFNAENISRQGWNYLIKKGVGRENNVYLFASVLSCEFDKIEYADGRFWVNKGDLKGVFNSVGETIVRCDYDEIKFTDGRYWVRKGDLKGVLNSAGGTIVSCNYDEIRFTDGRYWVRNGNSKGVLNSAGGTIVRPEYSEINFINGRYWVHKSDLKGVLNSAGGSILRCEYDKIELTSDGKYIAYKDGKKNLYNSAGGRLHTEFDIIHSTD